MRDQLENLIFIFDSIQMNLLVKSHSSRFRPKK